MHNDGIISSHKHNLDSSSVSNSISRESLFQKRIENLRRENERLRDQAQQRAKMKQQGVTPSSSKSSSCSSSIAEQPMYLSPEQLMLHHPPSSSPSNTVAMDPVLSTSTSSSPATTTAGAIEMTPSTTTTITHADTKSSGPLDTSVSPMMTRKMSTAESVASNNKQTTTQPIKEKEIQQSSNQPTKLRSDEMMTGIVSSALDASNQHQGLSATAEPPQQPAAQPNVYDMAFTMPQHLTSTPTTTAVSLMDQQHSELPTATMMDVNGYYLPPRTMMMAPPPLPAGTQQQQQHMIPPFSTGSPNNMMPFPMMDMSFPGTIPPNGTTTTHPTPPPVSYMPDAATFQFHAAAMAYPPPAYNAQPDQPTATIHSKWIQDPFFITHTSELTLALFEKATISYIGNTKRSYHTHITTTIKF